MTPAYFPFSHISMETAEKIYKHFGKIVTYLPFEQPASHMMNEFAKRGLIDIRFPLKPHEEKIAAAFSEYLRWMDMNRGTRGIGTQFFRERRETIPFFDESSTLRIRSDIKAKAKGVEKDKTEEILFGAGLFSAVSKNFDAGNEELELNLDRFNDLEKNFLETLNVDEKTEMPAGRSPIFRGETDRGAYMTRERIMAWGTMMMEDERTPEFFITTSRAVVQYLVELAPAGVPPFITIPEPESAAGILETVTKLSKSENISNEAAQTPVNEAALSSEKKTWPMLYVVPGTTPASYFNSLLPARDCTKDITRGLDVKNTVICLFAI